MTTGHLDCLLARSWSVMICCCWCLGSKWFHFLCWCCFVVWFQTPPFESVCQWSHSQNYAQFLIWATTQGGTSPSTLYPWSSYTSPPPLHHHDSYNQRIWTSKVPNANRHHPEPTGQQLCGGECWKSGSPRAPNRLGPPLNMQKVLIEYVNKRFQ